MTNKILITGSDGFIGSHLLNYLRNQGYYPETCDLKQGSSIFDDSFPKKVEWADVVFHLAALTSVQESFEKPEEYYDTNVKGTSTVASWCVKFKKKLIYISSAAVYQPESSPYAQTKKEAEEFVILASADIPVVVPRLFNVYGKGMHGNVMDHFLHDNPIKINGDGTQTRDFIHVSTVIKILVDTMKEKYDGNVFDVGLGKGISMNLLGCLFSNLRMVNAEYDDPKPEIHESVADIKKLQRLYKGSFLKRNLKEDVKQLIKDEYEI